MADGRGAARVTIERGVADGAAKRADSYRPRRAGPVPLAPLWHGVGPDERDVLEPLAAAR